MDDARRIILARRAAFVTAALASVACHNPESKPEPCLSVVETPEPDAGPPPPTQSAPPIYEPPIGPPDADAGKPDAGHPRPCLKVRPQPLACLRMMTPPDK